MVKLNLRHKHILFSGVRTVPKLLPVGRGRLQLLRSKILSVWQVMIHGPSYGTFSGGKLNLSLRIIANFLTVVVFCIPSTVMWSQIPDDRCEDIRIPCIFVLYHVVGLIRVMFLVMMPAKLKCPTENAPKIGRLSPRFLITPSLIITIRSTI
jgi:hypothetical protein